MKSWPDPALYLLAGAVSAASFLILYRIAKAIDS